MKLLSKTLDYGCKEIVIICGQCSLNNVLPEHIEHATILEMNEIVDDLWLRMATNPEIGHREVIDPMRTTNGYYNMEVLLAALKSVDWRLILLRASKNSVEKSTRRKSHE